MFAVHQFSAVVVLAMASAASLCAAGESMNSIGTVGNNAAGLTNHQQGLVSVGNLVDAIGTVVQPLKPDLVGSVGAIESPSLGGEGDAEPPLSGEGEAEPPLSGEGEAKPPLSGEGEALVAPVGGTVGNAIGLVPGQANLVGSIGSLVQPIASNPVGSIGSLVQPIKSDHVGSVGTVVHPVKSENRESAGAGNNSTAQPIKSDDQSLYRSLCGVDLAGGDIGSDASSYATACALQCMVKDGCDASTWTNHNGGTCWYKTYNKGGVKPVPNAGAFSFLRKPDYVNGFPSSVIKANVDFPGNDIGNEPAATPDICFGSCMLTAKCNAATWSNYNGGTCWMKAKATAYVANSGVISVIVTKVFLDTMCPV